MARTTEKRPSMIHRAFAERFKAERERNGYSQRDIAKILKASQEIIAAYETARAVPYAEDLVAVALLFKVSADYLLGMTRKRGPYQKDI